MSTPAPSQRRLALAVGTAAAAITLAVGVTAASLLGWFRPAEHAPEVTPVPVVEPVPAPAEPAPDPEAAPMIDPTVDVQLAVYDDDHGDRDEDHGDDDDDDDDEDHDDDD